MEHLHGVNLHAGLAPRSLEGWQGLHLQDSLSGTEEAPQVILEVRPQRTQHTPT